MRGRLFLSNAAAAPSPKSTTPQGVHFVARQPIFDRQRRLFGYELLFRDSWENSFGAVNADFACQSTLDSTLLMGLEFLCDQSIAFINCTRATLLNDFMTLLPRERVVLEILETVQAEPEIIEVCTAPKNSGYRLALDDFVANDPRHDLIPLADVLKVDWRAVTPQQCRDIMKQYARPNLIFLAEKIEIQPDLQAAMDLGSHYFQGYFSRTP